MVAGDHITLFLTLWLFGLQSWMFNVTDSYDFPDTNPNDGSTVHRDIYSSQNHESELWFLHRLRGWARLAWLLGKHGY